MILKVLRGLTNGHTAGNLQEIAEAATDRSACPFSAIQFYLLPFILAERDKYLFRDKMVNELSVCSDLLRKSAEIVLRTTVRGDICWIVESMRTWEGQRAEDTGWAEVGRNNEISVHCDKAYKIDQEEG